MNMINVNRYIARLLAISAAFFGVQALAQYSATATGPASAVAQSQQAQPGDSAAALEQLDGNKDGFVDKKEATGMPGLSAIFDKADVNRDGKLDMKELQVAMARMK